jgi:NAD-dependent deacetylase
LKKLVVLSGAGISKESGIPTYRDKGGLWEKYDPEYYATIEGWKSNQNKMIEFYNMIRKKISEINPNDGHYELVKLENKFDVQIITQNIDDLHERAGSKKVLHLHGSIKSVRSQINPEEKYEIGFRDIEIGENCSNGKQLRPDIVWFGEEVPLISKAIDIVRSADIFVIIGTSLQVYPASTLKNYLNTKEKWIIDPSMNFDSGWNRICKKASLGVKEFSKKIINMK